jgi:DNA-binding GntR family transcriptional regulator
MKQSDTENLTQDVYDSLLKKMMNNELRPGTILSRKEISEELNVSLAPVRDALIRLTVEGFVEAFPRKGTVVRAITRENIYGALMMREAVETQAARIYYGSKMNGHMEELEEYAVLLDSTDSKDNEHLEHEIMFHSKLVELSSCESLIREFKRLMHVNIFYRVNALVPNDDKQERMNHRELLFSLRDASSAEEADFLIREHLRSGKRSFFQS